MRRIALFVAALAAVTAVVPGPAGAAPGTLWTQGTGEAVDCEQARQRALNDAVRRAAGIWLEHEREVANGRLTHDRTRSYANGYVERYQVVARHWPAHERCALVVRAQVRPPPRDRLPTTAASPRGIDGEALATRFASEHGRVEQARDLVRPLLERLSDELFTARAGVVQVIHLPERGGARLRITAELGVSSAFVETLLSRLALMSTQLPPPGWLRDTRGQLMAAVHAPRRQRHPLPAMGDDTELDALSRHGLFALLEADGRLRLASVPARPAPGVVAGHLTRALHGRYRLVVTLLDEHGNAVGTRRHEMNRPLAQVVHGWPGQVEIGSRGRLGHGKGVTLHAASLPLTRSSGRHDPYGCRSQEQKRCSALVAVFAPWLTAPYPLDVDVDLATLARTRAISIAMQRAVGNARRP